MSENISENELILENWIKQIENLPKLDFNSAKTLYTNIMNETDEEKKEYKLNELIEGTLHVVADFIKRNILANVTSIDYDMGDIINSCNELWIKSIKEGALLTKKSFASIFGRPFWTQLTEVLNENDFKVSEITILTSDDFHELLYNYIKFYEKNGEASYEDFLRVINEYFENIKYSFYVPHRFNNLELSDSDLLQQTYDLFENIVSSIEDENGNINCSKTSLSTIKNILLEIGIKGLRTNIDEVYIKDYEDGLIKRIITKELIDYVVNSGILLPREKDVVLEYHGINGEEEMNYDELGKIYNVTKSRIGEIYKKALAKLRLDTNIRKYRK